MLVFSTPAGGAAGGNRSGVSVTVSGGGRCTYHRICCGFPGIDFLLLILQYVPLDQVRVAAAAADGRRSAALTVFGCGSISAGAQGCTHDGTQGHVFSVLPGESSLDMRILVDRIIVEVFVQGGRVAYTKSFAPEHWTQTAVQLLASNGTALASSAKVWSMGCGWVGADEQAKVWQE